MAVLSTLTPWVPRLLFLSVLGVPLGLIWSLERDTWSAVFYTILVLRYARLFGHMLSWLTYRPIHVRADEAFTRQDVTVIVPTVDPHDRDFQECMRGILRNAPAAVLVITVGPQLRDECTRVIDTLRPFALTRVAVSAVPRASKRRQVAHALDEVNTRVTVLADDHVIWPTDQFLPSLLAPLVDDRVGVVATRKRVGRTTPGTWSWSSIVNLIACLYLERHNWELRASSQMDGGLFVVSGRTAAYRSDFLKDRDLLDRYTHERFMFGLLGGDGLGPDDDNFLTREAIRKGWLVRFQATHAATMLTSLGTWPKFSGQLLRWARTTFRSNPVMLRDPVFLYRYTWSAFMVYLASLVNFAIV